MTALAEKIYNEVLDLPNDERMCLLDRLLHVIPVPSAVEIEKAWLDEAHRRLDELRSGQARSIPGEDVFADVRARLQK